LAIEFSSIPRLLDAAPLLKEEWHFGFAALQVNVTNPIFVHHASARATLTPDDHPVNPAEVQGAHRSNERLNAEEAHTRSYLAQVIHAPAVVGILNADPHPDVGWDLCPTREFSHPLGPFRQHLKLVLARLSHGFEDPGDEGGGEILVE
jgi:hypothetical protein